MPAKQAGCFFTFLFRYETGIGSSIRIVTRWGEKLGKRYFIYGHGLEICLVHRHTSPRTGLKGAGNKKLQIDMSFFGNSLVRSTIAAR